MLQLIDIGDSDYVHQLSTWHRPIYLHHLLNAVTGQPTQNKQRPSFSGWKQTRSTEWFSWLASHPATYQSPL